MVNTQLLDRKFDEKGVKICRVAEMLGITPQSLRNKRMNKTLFKASEIYFLCDFFNFSEQDKNDIFFANDV